MREMQLQSLFCWNTFCYEAIKKTIKRELPLQSLFCWNTFCYKLYTYLIETDKGSVAILVLLEHLLLPFWSNTWIILAHLSCNPCFAGTPSATNR
ncbi:hypothetical protein KTGMC3_P2258 [Methanocalculus sp. MC3]